MGVDLRFIHVKTNGSSFVASQSLDIGDGRLSVSYVGYLAVNDYVQIIAWAATSDTLDDTYYTVLCECTSNAITINLPAVSGNEGLVYNIKKIDSTGNAVTVDANSSETIDDATTQTISSQYDSIQIICDGSEWWII